MGASQQGTQTMAHAPKKLRADEAPTVPGELDALYRRQAELRAELMSRESEAGQKYDALFAACKEIQDVLGHVQEGRRRARRT
jgi:hypothetical protein